MERLLLYRDLVMLDLGSLNSGLMLEVLLKVLMNGIVLSIMKMDWILMLSSSIKKIPDQLLISQVLQPLKITELFSTNAMFLLHVLWKEEFILKTVLNLIVPLLLKVLMVLVPQELMITLSKMELALYLICWPMQVVLLFHTLNG